MDVGFGDSIAVQPVDISFPSMLDMPAPQLRAYRMETTVAEKCDAILTLGVLNSRMKDYFDLWFLAKNFAFDGGPLAASIEATCQRRGHTLPAAVPQGLSDIFWNDSSPLAIWKTFWSKNVRLEPMLSLQEVVAFTASFLLPPMMAAAQKQPFTASWKPGGPWEGGGA